MLENRQLLSAFPVSWTGGGGDDLWNDPANWSDDAGPRRGRRCVDRPERQSHDPDHVGAQAVHSLTSSDMISISGGSLSVAASSSLTGGLTMTGGSLSATGSGTVLTVSGTTTISAASLYASGSATLSLPNLTSFSSNQSTFQADGTGSVLDVSALTNVTQQGPCGHRCHQRRHAQFERPDKPHQHTRESTSPTPATAPLLDSSLTSLTADQLAGIVVTLDGTDAHVADSWNSFTDSNLNVTGGSYTLPGLTDVDGSSLYVSNGGSLALAGLTSLNSNFSTFQADGAGSVLDVSALTNVSQQGYLGYRCHQRWHAQSGGADEPYLHQHHRRSPTPAAARSI